MTRIIVLHSKSIHSTPHLHAHTMSRNTFQCTRILSQCLGTVSHRPIAPITATITASRRRCLHSMPPTQMRSQPPKTRDRGPKSNEDTQTDFSALDVLRNTIAPATSIDACTSDGFALNNQVRLSGSGILLLGGEAFRWWPWAKEGEVEGSGGMVGKLLNAKGQWEVQQSCWGVLELVHPKPGTFTLHPRLKTASWGVCETDKSRLANHRHRTQRIPHRAQRAQVP
jgi:NADH dehydrogenase [ubiquinone] 1 alpha subcomplex assembly factor 3